MINGEFIDFENFDKEEIYNYIIEYYNNPILTKIKNDNLYSMYSCKLYCLLNNQCRYIVLFVPINKDISGSTKSLDNLKWISFQTRTLPNDIYKKYINNDITVHSYEAVNDGPLLAVIKRIKQDKEYSKYNCETLPIEIILLHTEKNTAETYQNSGTVIAALETFQTILSFS